MTNAGPSDVTGASVSDIAPAGFNNTSWTATFSSGVTGVTASGSGNVNDTLNMPASGTVTYTVTGTVMPSATGVVVTTATVTAPSGATDPNTSNNVATAIPTRSMPITADLQITDSFSQGAYPSGSPQLPTYPGVTYTIVVTDASPQTVTGAVVSDNLSASLTNASYSTTTSGTVSDAHSSGTGAINDTVNLASGSSITYTVTGAIPSSVTASSLSDTATVTSPGGTPDPNTVNNTATATASITNVADLQITNSDGSASVTAGSPDTYTVIVSNNGPSDVSGATVSDIAPSGFNSTSWTATFSSGVTGVTTNGTGNIGDTVYIPTGGTITYTITGTVSPTASGTLTTLAQVARPSGSTDPNTGNNMASDSDTIISSNIPVDLSVVVSDSNGGTTSNGNTSGGTATVNNPVTYTIVVTNTSASNAVNGVSIVDSLSSSYFSGTPSYTENASGGATVSTGGASPTSGNIQENAANMPALSSITYTLVGTVSSSATNFIFDTASVNVPQGFTDTNSSNNSSTDSIALPAAM